MYYLPPTDMLVTPLQIGLTILALLLEGIAVILYPKHRTLAHLVCGVVIILIAAMFLRFIF